MGYLVSERSAQVGRILCVTVSVLALTACGGGGGSAPAKTQTPVTPPPNNNTVPTIVHEPSNPSDPASWHGREYDNSTGFDLINAAEAYASRTTGELGGKGVKIAILDTGIDTSHADLDGAVSYTATIQPAHQLTSHGTYVASVAGARRHQNEGDVNNRMGVAYASDLVDLRISRPGTENGESVSFFDFAVTASAIASVAGVDATYTDSRGTYQSDLNAEADIMNLSFGGFNQDQSGQVFSAMQQASAEEKIIIVAAGNDSNFQPIYEATLAAHAEISGLGIVVVGVDSSGSLTDFSNHCGSTLNYCIAAPANNINVAEQGGGYTARSGTSSAAPMVAGAAAVIKAAFPGVSPREIVERLFKSGSNADTGPTAEMGWGLLDLNKAMNPIGSVGIAQGKKATGSRLSLAGAVVTSTPVTGDLLAGSSLAPRAVVFDEMGFPFRADLHSRSRLAQASNLLSSTIGHVRAQSHAGGQVGRLQYRMSFEQNHMDYARQDQAVVSGRLSLRVADGVWLDASFAEPVAFSQSVGGVRAAGTSVLEASAPFSMLLGTSDGLALQAGMPFGGSMTFSHSRAADRRLVALTPDMAEQQFYYQGNSFQQPKQLTTVSYSKNIVGLVHVAATAGRLRESISFLGGEVAGAFAGKDGSTTDYMEFKAHTRLLGFDLSGSYTRGRTDVGASALISDMQNVKTEAYSLSAVAYRLFNSGDQLSFSWSQPLNVAGGSYQLRLPVGRLSNGSVLYESETVEFSGYGLKVLEATYGMPVAGGISMNLSAFRRQAADRSVYSEVGAGMRLNMPF